MFLTEEDIKQFQDIIWQAFGKKISSDEARQEAVKLITLMRIITNNLSGDSKDNSNLIINKR